MKKAAIATFGCKLNQYETQLMAEQLQKEYDISDFNNICDLYIINSCAVTSKAAKESRNAAKRAKKLNPDAKIIYTGCDSYLEENLQATVVGNSYKNNILSAVYAQENDLSQETKNYSINVKLSQYNQKSRVFIKIQEGCNNHCTYCIIPKLRGRERDKDIELVLDEIKGLSHFAEVVLSGTNIGSYKNLKALLRRIDDLGLSTRIRISSIEPMYIDDEFIDIVAGGNFAKHLHIPLQSGCDKILKLMGRDYKRKEFEKIVNRCHKSGIFVGTDVIVGFFGETESEFSETYNFINNLPLSFGHVFSYSKRPDTSAVNIKMNLSRGPIVRQRNAQLKKLFDMKFKESVESMINKTTDVVVEPTIFERNRKIFYRAISSQYFPVLVSKRQNGIVGVKIKGFDGEFAYA
jgi:threonylcarbamoyladenosine tRNA methylthiotransferase MtaB